MKGILIFTLIAAGSLSAKAVNISFGGGSGQFMYQQLQQRQGTNRWETKSILGNKVESVGFRNLLECWVTHGRVFGDSYGCKIPGTDATDIQGSFMIGSAKDELSGAIADLNNSILFKSPLRINGTSAARIFSQLNSGEMRNDPTFFARTGATKFTKTPFDGVGISEVYCQVNHGRIFGDSYSCLIANVALKDSNAPATDISPNIGK